MKTKKNRKKNQVGGLYLKELSNKKNVDRVNNIILKTTDILSIVNEKVTNNSRINKIKSIQDGGKYLFDNQEAKQINLLGKKIIRKYNRLILKSGSKKIQMGGFSDFFRDKEKKLFGISAVETVPNFISKTLKGSTKCNKELLSPIDMILWFLGSLWFIGGPADFAAFIKSILFGNIKSAIVLFLNRLLFFQDPALKIFYLGQWINADYLESIKEKSEANSEEKGIKQTNKEDGPA